MYPIEALARYDRGYMGSGEGSLFVPTFPVLLDAPGYWHEATIYQYHLATLFTMTLLESSGREIRLMPKAHHWTPAELTVEYDVDGGGSATEIRTVQPGGVFASEWLLREVGER